MALCGAVVGLGTDCLRMRGAGDASCAECACCADVGLRFCFWRAGAAAAADIAARQSNSEEGAIRMGVLQTIRSV